MGDIYTPTAAASPESNDNMERLGGNVRRLFSAVNNLTHHGIDAIADISIPKIAIVGDQSAGKSSLVEALSQIQVPRDAGTCTRCPMEITVEGADSGWTANVSLLRTHSFDPGSDQDGNDFWPWIACTETVRPVDFKTIGNKDDLEDVLRLAQRAILTPTRLPSDIIATAEAAEYDMPFSPNVVVVKIRGEGLPNLSFIDLPGVISQSDDGPRMVDLVKHLARSYIRQHNTLVLLACSMENDIMNSSASGLITEEQANDRCIGVLTKPDRMAHGDDSATQWKEVLEGKKFRRGLGYFVTKQPGQQDLKQITHEEARIQEAKFFASPHWERLFPGFQDQLGTNVLADALSGNLVALIHKQLPTIRAKVEEKLEEINERLGGMPEPPLNPFHEVHRIVREYGLCIDGLVSNSPIDNALRQLCMTALCQFRQLVLESLRPKFLPYADLESSKRKSTTELPLRQGSADPVTPTKKSRTNVDSNVKRESGHKSRASAAIKLETPAASPSVTQTYVTPTRSTRKKNGSPLKHTLPPVAPTFSCLNLKQEIDKYEVPGLPGEVNPDGLNRLILSTVQNWQGPIETLFHTIAHGVRHHLNSVIARVEICGGYVESPLYKQMEGFTDDFIRSAVLAEKVKGLEAASREGLRPVIIDEEHFEMVKEKELSLLRSIRHTRRVETFTGLSGIELDLSNDQDKKRFDAMVAKKINGKEFGPDPFDREVEVIAKIKAYYRIASTRLTEAIFMIVEAGILNHLRTLSQTLELNLKLHSGLPQNHWAGMLEQNAQVAEERIRLTAQAQALESAFEELQQVTGVDSLDWDMEVNDDEEV